MEYSKWGLRTGCLGVAWQRTEEEDEGQHLFVGAVLAASYPMLSKGWPVTGDIGNMRSKQIGVRLHQLRHQFRIRSRYVLLLIVEKQPIKKAPCELGCIIIATFYQQK